MTENTQNNISELLVFKIFAVGGVSQNPRGKIFPFAYPTDFSNLISTFKITPKMILASFCLDVELT